MSPCAASLSLKLILVLVTWSRSCTACATYFASGDNSSRCHFDPPLIALLVHLLVSWDVEYTTLPLAINAWDVATLSLLRLLRKKPLQVSRTRGHWLHPCSNDCHGLLGEKRLAPKNHWLPKQTTTPRTKTFFLLQDFSASQFGCLETFHAPIDRIKETSPSQISGQRPVRKLKGWVRKLGFGNSEREFRKLKQGVRKLKPGVRKLET